MGEVKLEQMDGIKKGDRVRCINGDFSNAPKGTKFYYPKKGEIYTAREVIKTEKGIGISLEEVWNRKYSPSGEKGGYEPIFNINKFCRYLE